MEGAAAEAVEVRAVEHDLAAVRPVQAEQAAPQGGLARAGFAHDTHGLARVDGQRDVVRRHQLAAPAQEAAAEREHLAHVLRVEQGIALAVEGVAVLDVVGHGGDQLAGVGVLRAVEDLVGGADLHAPALLHDGHPVGDLGDHAEVMGDEHHRHAELALHPLDELQDLLLGGHVERGGGLVGDQQPRLQGQGHGDHHALALAAGEPEGIAAAQRLRLRQADGGEQLDHALAAAGGVHFRVGAQRLVDLLAHPHQRVEGGHGLLEDHAHVAAAHRALLRLAAGEHVPAVEDGLAVGDLHVGRGEQAHDGVGGHGLARAGLADDAQQLVLGDGEVDVLHRMGALGALGEADGQPPHVQDDVVGLAHVSLSPCVRVSG